MQEKNSNKPAVAQEALLTDAMPIFLLDVGDPESGLIQVCAGKPAAEASAQSVEFGNRQGGAQ